MTQTIYNTRNPVGFAGMEAELLPSIKGDAVNKHAGAIPWGVALAQGSGLNERILPAAATAVIRGVALHTNWQDNRALADALAVKQDDFFPEMLAGSMHVKVEEDVTSYDDPVFVRITSDGGSNTQLGSFRKSHDSGRAMRINARWLTLASAGGVAIVQLRDPLTHREPFSLPFSHAQVTADTLAQLIKAPADRFLVLERVDYVNPTGLAAHATNFFNLKMQSAGPVVHANWSTEDTAEGALVAGTYVAFTLGANPVVPPGGVLSLNLDEDGTATLPAGNGTIHGYYV